MLSLFLCNEYFLDFSLKLVFIFRVCIDSKESLPFASFIQHSLTGKFPFDFRKMSVDLFQIPGLKIYHTRLS